MHSMLLLLVPTKRMFDKNTSVIVAMIFDVSKRGGGVCSFVDQLSLLDGTREVGRLTSGSAHSDLLGSLRLSQVLCPNDSRLSKWE